tara:strand:- start:1348 stop:1530 length:183 start_codon:yes stop_codon:yes gene_type:complete
MSEHSEKDSLLVEYDEDTRQMKLEWDDNDPKWSWLNSLSEEEVHEIITTNLKTLLENEGE